MKKILSLLSAVLFLSISLGAQTEANLEYDKELKKFRKDYVKSLLADDRAPLEKKKDAKSVQFFEPNSAFIVKCLFIRTGGEAPFDMKTYAEETKPYIKYGELLFEIPGKGTKRISVYQSLKALKMPMYKDHLFIPFNDPTNGDTTYGGGRYIDLKVSDIKQGIVLLDFNKAYNPWCAYSDGFNCPIPPKENNLDIAILAGEMDFMGEKPTLPKS